LLMCNFMGEILAEDSDPEIIKKHCDTLSFSHF
jgi:hypothetical protein